MQPCVYIIANERNGTIYTGVTSDLKRRVYQHKNDYFEGFSKKYNCKDLVYFETTERMDDAIAKEKQIKAGSRKSKLKLIEASNPTWRDLYDDI